MNRSLGLPTALSFLVITTGCLVCLGWLARIDLLIAPLNGPPMLFAGAIGLVIAGMLLYLTEASKNGRDWEMANFGMGICLILLTIIAIPALAVHLLGSQVGTGDFFTRPGGEINGPVINPSTGASWGIAIVALIAFLLFFEPPMFRKTVTLCGLLLISIGGLAIIGFAIGSPALYYFSSTSSGLPVHGAVLFSLLGIGFILSVRANSAGSSTKEEGDAS